MRMLKSPNNNKIIYTYVDNTINKIMIKKKSKKYYVYIFRAINCTKGLSHRRKT